jgi:heat shock protein HtpX
MWELRLRAYLASAIVFGLFFGFFYVLIYLFAPSAAYLPIFGRGGNALVSWISWVVVFDIGVAFLVVFAQFWFSPTIIRWSAQVRYVSAEEEPALHQVVEELSRLANIPKPQVGISELPESNAFAYGRWLSDGRICVTRSLLGLLPPDELRSVLAHEISHLRHHDMAFMTLLQVVPLVTYTIARAIFHTRAHGKGAGQLMIAGAVAFLIYLISTLLVLYVSRLREAYADRGSVEITGQKAPLASALFRITKDTSSHDKNEIKQLGGTRALLITDPYRAAKDAASFDWDQVAPDGTFSEVTLQEYDRDVTKLGWHLRLAETLSTHPLLEHRLKLLAELPIGPSFRIAQANLRLPSARSTAGREQS